MCKMYGVVALRLDLPSLATGSSSNFSHDPSKVRLLLVAKDVGGVQGGINGANASTIYGLWRVCFALKMALSIHFPAELGM